MGVKIVMAKFFELPRAAGSELTYLGDQVIGYVPQGDFNFSKYMENMLQMMKRNMFNAWKIANHEAEEYRNTYGEDECYTGLSAIRESFMRSYLDVKLVPACYYAPYLSFIFKTYPDPNDTGEAYIVLNIENEDDREHVNLYYVVDAPVLR